jgi:hypothetical protein
MALTVWRNASVVAACEEALLAEARVAQEAALVAELEAIAGQITGLVPRAEMQSWDAKEKAAQAIADGVATQADLDLLGIEAALVGESLEVLVGKVLVNAGAYRRVAPLIAGIRRTALRAFAEAGSVGEIRAASAAALATFRSHLEAAGVVLP